MHERLDFSRGWPFKPTPRGRRISREELERRERALARVPLFSDLPANHLRSIARLTGVSTHRGGTTIVKEGQPGSVFYVILEGEARVMRGGRAVRRLSAGDYFGEISLLDGGPRSASVIASGESVCLGLTGTDFRQTVSHEPALALRIMAELAKWIRRGDRPRLG